jgi:hypothetical protein
MLLKLIYKDMLRVSYYKWRFAYYVFGDLVAGGRLVLCTDQAPSIRHSLTCSLAHLLPTLTLKYST